MKNESGSGGDVYDDARTLRDAVREHGYALAAVTAKADADLVAVARTLGTPAVESRDRVLVKTISPVAKEDAPRNTLSERYGAGAFPFHTDTAYWRRPASFLLLWCESPGAGTRPTLLCDTSTWKLSRDETDILRREVWVVRDTRQPFLCSVLGERGDVRIDFDCMLPAISGRGRARAIVAEALSSARVEEVRWAPNTMLVIDNRRMLHARAASSVPDPDRRLKRVLVMDGAP